MSRTLQFSFSVLLILLAQKITFIRSECVHGNLYSHATDCERFYQCSHGELIELICYPGLYFNSEINVCDWPDNVLCKFEPETTQKTTLETTQQPVTTTTHETTLVTTQQPNPTASTTLETTLATSSSTTQNPITTTTQRSPVCDVCSPFNIEMEWSYIGPITGKHCVLINESADPHTWDDNFLCFKSDYGVQWSYNHPIAGMRCTQIIETADPNAWSDNYLCVPTTSTFSFAWSSAGSIPNSCCTRMYEPSDPHTWDDNYLCLVSV